MKVVASEAFLQRTIMDITNMTEAQLQQENERLVQLLQQGNATPNEAGRLVAIRACLRLIQDAKRDAVRPL